MRTAEGQPTAALFWKRLGTPLFTSVDILVGLENIHFIRSLQETSCQHSQKLPESFLKHRL